MMGSMINGCVRLSLVPFDGSGQSLVGISELANAEVALENCERMAVWVSNSGFWIKVLGLNSGSGTCV